MVTLADGKRLEADRVSATVSRPEGDVTFIRASGNAAVAAPGGAGGRRASADEIEYTKETGLAVLSGDVTIMDGSSSLAGDRAEFNLNSGESRLTSESGRVGGVINPAN